MVFQVNHDPILVHAQLVGVSRIGKEGGVVSFTPLGMKNGQPRFLSRIVVFGETLGSVPLFTSNRYWSSTSRISAIEHEVGDVVLVRFGDERILKPTTSGQRLSYRPQIRFSPMPGSFSKRPSQAAAWSSANVSMCN